MEDPAIARARIHVVCILAGSRLSNYRPQRCKCSAAQCVNLPRPKDHAVPGDDAKPRDLIMQQVVRPRERLCSGRVLSYRAQALAFQHIKPGIM